MLLRSYLVTLFDMFMISMDSSDDDHYHSNKRGSKANVVKHLKREKDSYISLRTRLKDKSLSYAISVKIYCALHRPVGIYLVYHALVLTIIVVRCVVFNVFLDMIKEKMNDTHVIHVMACLDLILIVILVIELILRLRSCSCVHEFRGVRGRLNYLRSFMFMRTLDCLGVITFIASIVYLAFPSRPYWPFIVISLLLLLQVFQFYRMSIRVLKLMSSTISSQFKALCIALVFALLVLMFTTFGIYLFEKEANAQINNIFDALYLGIITLATIGYGDIHPETTWGKILICVCALIGISLFALPASIFGTGLAIKVQEQHQIFKHRQPAAKIILSLWRCYGANRESSSPNTWSAFKRKDGAELTDADKKCIRLIRIAKYLVSRSRFKNLTHAGGDELEQQNLIQKMQRIDKKVNQSNQKLASLAKEVDSVKAMMTTMMSRLDDIAMF